MLRVCFPVSRSARAWLKRTLLAVALLLPGTVLRADAGVRPRVLVSTDVGGTDPDDFQSLVHLLLYADVLDVEGLVASPYGPGRKEHILEVIAQYERDLPALRMASPRYPDAAELRAMTRQGAIDLAGFSGIGERSEGSDWIIACARRPDPRPLWVLVWGGIDDLARALHDAPEIAPKLRVYFIGGPNKMWSVNAYTYVAREHPELWFIEANATYRGWFVGGEQTGEWGNTGFVSTHLAGRGALGSYFATHLRGTIKMGDSPSVGYLLRGTPDDPAQPGWGGRFVRIWEGREAHFDRWTTAADEVEAFGTLELAVPAPADLSAAAETYLLVDNRVKVIGQRDGSVLRFRFSPRDAKQWSYVVHSPHPELQGRTGEFTAVLPVPERVREPSRRRPQWWLDDPAPEWREGVHLGAKTVNRWRREFLTDFAARIQRTVASP